MLTRPCRKAADLDGMKTHSTSSAEHVIVRAPRRRGAVVIGLGAAILTFGAASAASIGGIKSLNLGSDSEVVASCDTDGVVSHYDPAYNAAIGGYAANVVIVEEIDDRCKAQHMQVTLSDSAGNVLGQSVVRDAEPSGMKFDDFKSVPASKVSNISVVFWQ